MFYGTVVDKLRHCDYFDGLYNHNSRDAEHPNVKLADFLEDSSNDYFDGHFRNIVNHYFSSMKRDNLEVVVCDSQDYQSYMLVNHPLCLDLNGCLSHFPLLSSTLK